MNAKRKQMKKKKGREEYERHLWSLLEKALNIKKQKAQRKRHKAKNASPGIVEPQIDEMLENSQMTTPVTPRSSGSIKESFEKMNTL